MKTAIVKVVQKNQAGTYMTYVSHSSMHTMSFGPFKTEKSAVAKGKFAALNHGYRSLYHGIEKTYKGIEAPYMNDVLMKILANSTGVAEEIDPGRVLLLGFILPNDLTIGLTARLIGMTWHNLNGVVTGSKRITAQIAMRLAVLFGVDEKFWMEIQSISDLNKARDRYNLDWIEPL